MKTPKYPKGTKVTYIGNNSFHFTIGETLTISTFYNSSAGNICYFFEESGGEPATEKEVRPISKLERALK